MTEVEPEVVEEQVSNGVTKQQRSDRAIRHLAEIWVAMAATDAWQQLQVELEKQQQIARNALVDAVLNNEAEVSQRDVDFKRGLIEGLGRPMLAIKVAQDLLDGLSKPAPEPEPEEPGAWS